MSITTDEIAAFADGELSGTDAARIAAAVEADPELAARVAAHRALKQRLAGHFAPILEQPVPERLISLLLNTDAVTGTQTDGIVDFAAAKERLEARRRLPAWSWGGAAIAASLVAATLFVMRGEESPQERYAGVRLASALDTQLAASQPSDADARILLTFRNDAGEYCRAYSETDASGIACHDSNGWRLETVGKGGAAQNTEFRMAGSKSEVLAAAQDMAVAGALSAGEEAAARKRGWRN